MIFYDHLILLKIRIKNNHSILILFTVEPKYQFFRYSVINNLVCGENSVARLNSVRTFFINIYGNKHNSMWMCTWIIIGNFVMVRSFRFCFRNFRIFVCDTHTEIWIFGVLYTVNLAKYLDSFERNKFLMSLKFDYIGYSPRAFITFKWILWTHLFRFGPKWARK